MEEASLMTFLGIHFANPQYLVWGFAAVLLVIAFLRTKLWRNEVLTRLGFRAGQAFSAPVLRPLKTGMFLAGFLFIWLALLGPQWGQKEFAMKASGLDLCIGLDLSKSMLAEDLLPNRLEAVKNQLPLFFQELSGDRVAIVPFAGSAFIASPLTNDYAALSSILDPLDPAFISDQSTNLASGVDGCLSALGVEKIQQAEEILSESSKVILLITDGGSTTDEESAPVEKASKLGIPIAIMGVGSVQGAFIPVRDSYGIQYLKDPQTNQPITTKLEEKPLKSLAEKTQGELFFATAGTRAWKSFKKYLDKFERDSQEAGSKKNLEDRFQIPLLIGFILLLLEFMIPETKFWLLLFFLLTPSSLKAASGSAQVETYIDTWQGLRSFSKKEFEESVKFFSESLESSNEEWTPRYNWATGKLWLSLPKETEGPAKPGAPIPRTLQEAEKELLLLDRETTAPEMKKILKYQLGWVYWLKQNRIKALESFYSALNISNFKELDDGIKQNITLLLTQMSQSGGGSGEGESKGNEGDQNDPSKKFTQGKGEEAEFKGTDVDEGQAKKILQSVGTKERETQKKKSRGESKDRAPIRKGDQNGQSGGKDPQW
jgi:Ca-activated chloride channel homolog